MATLIDFSNIQHNVNQIYNDYGFSNKGQAFVFYGLQKILGINDSEILDAITDGSGDRGIDAVYFEELEESDGKINIHLFQFKYKENYEKIHQHFESNETNKMCTFINQVFSLTNRNLLNINNLLADKISDILEILDQRKLGDIIIHFCSNTTNSLVDDERINFEGTLDETYSNIDFRYHTIDSLVEFNHEKKPVDGKISIVDKNYFETSDGEIRGIICQVDALDLINAIKNKNKGTINEDIFHDNVRVYLGNRKKSINEKIKQTVLDESENFKFFYYNNGITITCNNFTFSKGIRNPEVLMKNFQIVNGQQTIKTLFDVYKTNENNKNFDILLLIRIYETNGENKFEISQKIAEYTNSQNPVKLRDIRANDSIQRKYAEAFKIYGYYYENKKYLHADKNNKLRVDSELFGQILLSFYGLKPGEASNKKSIIYGDEYKNIFNPKRTSQELFFPFLLFKRIEEEKQKYKKLLLEGEKQDYGFIKYATFTILYDIGRKSLIDFESLKTKLDIEQTVDDIFLSEYSNSIESIKVVVDKTKKELKDTYTHNNFFKNNIYKKNVEA